MLNCNKYGALILLLFFAVKVKASNPDLEKFLVRYNDSLSNATTIEDSIRLYYDVFRKCIRKSAVKSVELGELAYYHAKSIEDKKSMAKIKHILSIPLMTIDSMAKAERYLIDALQYYRKNNMDYEVSRALAMYGWYLIRNDKYITAIDTFNLSLDIKRKLKDEKGIADIYNRIGISYAKMEQYEKANEYYLEIVDNALKGKNKAYLQAASYNAANNFQRLGDFENAKKYYQISIKQRTRNGIENMENKNRGYYYFSMAKVNKIDKEIPQALQHLDSALHYFQMADSYSDISMSLSEKVSYYVDSKEFVKAFETMKEAEKITKFKNLTRLRHYSKLKAEVYEGLNRTDSAYHYYKQFIAVKDSINKQNFDKQLLDYKYEIEKERNLKEGEILRLRNKTLKTNFLIVLGFLSLIMFLIYRQYKRIGKSNLILQGKNQIIETSLKEKEILLKEIHHRVKNNLQIVSSMLNLHSRHIQDKGALQAITESRNRVRSIALIHQNLYKKNNLDSILISPYIRNLCLSLFHSYQVNEEKIKLVTDIDPMDLDVDTGIPLGLIINELITNSVKYAFPDNRVGEILVSLKEKENRLELIVKDNGVGLERELKIEHAETFGYSLIDSLATKLKASIDINGSDGMTTKLTIKKYTKK